MRLVVVENKCEAGTGAYPPPDILSYWLSVRLSSHCFSRYVSNTRNDHGQEQAQFSASPAYIRVNAHRTLIFGYVQCNLHHTL